VANGYIVLDGKRYATAGRSAVESLSRAREVGLSIGAKTIIQDFGHTERPWDMTILVQLTPDDPLYGSDADLVTAYGKSSVTYTDVFGDDQGTVVMMGDLDLSHKYALVDPDVHFEVKIKLRKIFT
jgi:hypothetical protein